MVDASTEETAASIGWTDMRGSIMPVVSSEVHLCRSRIRVSRSVQSPTSISTEFPREFTVLSTGSARILRAFPNMETKRRGLELWRDGDWRCEWSSGDGHHQVRLFLGQVLVSELADGPSLDLKRQVHEWRAAAHADTCRTRSRSH